MRKRPALNGCSITPASSCTPYPLPKTETHVRTQHPGNGEPWEGTLEEFEKQFGVVVNGTHLSRFTIISVGKK